MQRLRWIFHLLRDEVVKLTQTVSDLVQKQTSSARTQIKDAVGIGSG